MLSPKDIGSCFVSCDPGPYAVIQLQLHHKHVFFGFFILRETSINLKYLYFHF